MAAQHKEKYFNIFSTVMINHIFKRDEDTGEFSSYGWRLIEDSVSDWNEFKGCRGAYVVTGYMWNNYMWNNKYRNIFSLDAAAAIIAANSVPDDIDFVFSVSVNGHDIDRNEVKDGLALLRQIEGLDFPILFDLRMDANITSGEQFECHGGVPVASIIDSDNEDNQTSRQLIYGVFATGDIMPFDKNESARSPICFFIPAGGKTERQYDKMIGLAKRYAAYKVLANTCLIGLVDGECDDAFLSEFAYRISAKTIRWNKNDFNHSIAIIERSALAELMSELKQDAGRKNLAEFKKNLVSLDAAQRAYIKYAEWCFETMRNNDADEDTAGNITGDAILAPIYIQPLGSSKLENNGMNKNDKTRRTIGMFNSNGCNNKITGKKRVLEYLDNVVEAANTRKILNAIERGVPIDDLLPQEDERLRFSTLRFARSGLVQ